MNKEVDEERQALMAAWSDLESSENESKRDEVSDLWFMGYDKERKKDFNSYGTNRYSTLFRHFSSACML